MKLEDLPNGSIVKYNKRVYCLQQGLDGRIVVDVETGFWFFLTDIKWRKFQLLFNMSR